MTEQNRFPDNKNYFFLKILKNCEET
jgi:hypothetical protein